MVRQDTPQSILPMSVEELFILHIALLENWKTNPYIPSLDGHDHLLGPRVTVLDTHLTVSLVVLYLHCEMTDYQYKSMKIWHMFLKSLVGDG